MPLYEELVFRGASTLNGMAVRGFEQQQLNGTRVYRAVRGMLRKGGTPTILSSLHTSPQQHQNQARYLYVHTSTPSPTTASSESAGIFAVSFSCKKYHWNFTNSLISRSFSVLGLFVSCIY